MIAKLKQSLRPVHSATLCHLSIHCFRLTKLRRKWRFKGLAFLKIALHMAKTIVSYHG